MTTFDLIGVPPFSPTTAYQVGQVVEYQTVVNEVTIAKVYVCIQATTPGILPTDSAYWNSNGVNGAAWQNNANVITTWEDNLETLATWTYATPPGTTFDGNSMLFTAPVDMYATNNTTDFDRYLLFPKRNIITDLPQEGSKIIPISWFNTYGEFVQWLNYNNETVAWINSV